jgi:uncharacterized membrane protein
MFLLWRISKLEADLDDVMTRVRSLEARPRPAAPSVSSAPAIAASTDSPAGAKASRPPAMPQIPKPPARPVEHVRPTPSPASEVPKPPLVAPTAVPESAIVSLEAQIGSRWLLYIGVIAIVVGVSYFEKLAIDSHWVGETARTVQGGIVGLLLVYAGLRFVRAGYAIYGQMISGGGIAVMYVSTYAAFNLYQLISRPAAFVLMVAITALAAWLADRQRSQGLALLAVGGGFATPFLLPAPMDAHVALFTYDAILIAGTMFLAHRREWPALNVVSYGFTALTVFSWWLRFYTSSMYLTTELFLTLFCAMYLYILRETWRDERAEGDAGRAILWTAPVAYYVASIAILNDHPLALLVYLIALALAGAIVSMRAGSIARLVFWVAVAEPLVVWIGGHGGRMWLTGGLTTVTAVYAIFLLAHLEWMRRENAPFSPVAIVLFHLNGLWAYVSAYLLIESVRVAAAAPVAAAFAIWNFLLAFALLKRQREHALHAAALGFTLLMVAIALQFDGAWITVGWAAEGAVVAALGLRERREWLRTGGLVLFTVAISRLMVLLFTAPPVDMVVLLNRRTACGVFIIALTYWLAWRHHQDRSEVAVALVTAQVLTLALLTSEIIAYWSVQDAAAGHSFLAGELMLSITWALYATGLIVAGIRLHYAPLRYVAIAVFTVTIAKVIAFDLAELDRIYRILSIIGVGVTLLVTSYLYHRFAKEVGESRSPAHDA